MTHLNNKATEGVQIMKVKGIRIDNRQEVVGYPIVDGVTGQHFIHAEGNSVNESDEVGKEGVLKFLAFEVIPETVVKSIGRKDRAGRDIYEYDRFFIYGEYDNGLYIEDRSGMIYVAYNPEYMQYCYYGPKGEELGSMVDYFDESEDEMEGLVIGNIKHHDA